MKKISVYCAVTLLAVIVLLLFQLVGMSLGLFDSDYEINRYAAEEPVVQATSRQPAGMTVAIVGKTALPAVEQACQYLGYQCLHMRTLQSKALEADWLIWADKTLSIETDLPRLTAYSASGKTLVFAQLPQVSLLLQQDDLCRLLGIQAVQSVAVRTQGVRLYDGFLLGGEAMYDDLHPVAPWLQLHAGYSVYLCGFVDSPRLAKPRTLPLLWRACPEKGFVFVCADDWLLRANCVGFFYAMEAQTVRTQLYPVVNAQTMMVQNFPYLSTENVEQINSWYHQTSEKLFFNALLPNVTAVFNNCNYPMTCLFSSCLDGSTPDSNIQWDSLKLYIRLIVGRSGEMGISGYSLDQSSGLDKLSRDLQKMEELARAYTLTVFASNGMAREEYEPLLQTGEMLAQIHTVVEPLGEDGAIAPLEYINDRVVRMPITQNGFDTSADCALSVRSLQTALLATNVSIDMKQVLYPEDATDDWALLNKVWSDTLVSDWKPFEKLDKLCVSDADRRARLFLNLRWSYEDDGDTLRIHIDDYTEPVYFILRRQDVSIYACENVEGTKLEDGTYLLKITAEDALVNLRDEHRMRIY